MSLNDQTVNRIAHLARIAIKPEETARLTKEFNHVLALVDQLRAIDTQSVEPMAHPLDMSQPLRQDKVTEPDVRASAQKIAPKTEAGLYLVPKVIE